MAPPTGLAQATPENPLRPTAIPEKVTRNSAGPPRKGRAKLSKFQLPPGFTVTLYSDQVPHARSLALGKGNTVFVSTRRDSRIYAMVDADHDGRAERVVTVAQDLSVPNGIAYRDGSLYIAAGERLLRLDQVDGNLDAVPGPVVVTHRFPAERHHGWRYLRFGPDGLLYMSIGAPCNVCRRENPLFASIVRMKPDGTNLERFASGIRNSVGFDWHPETDELWFTDNGRDLLGDDLPPDELNRADRKGLDFGFPHCHAGVILDPEFGKEKNCTASRAPAKNLGAHVAPLGLRFYSHERFPPKYRGAVFFAEHGSWNRSVKLGYRVSVITLKGNKVTSYEPFLQGLFDAKANTVSARPVDVEVMPDGALLVSDDYRGAVYRVNYARD